MVECTGLENRRACKRTVGSNPTLSAKTLCKAKRLSKFPKPEVAAGVSQKRRERNVLSAIGYRLNERGAQGCKLQTEVAFSRDAVEASFG